MSNCSNILVSFKTKENKTKDERVNPVAKYAKQFNRCSVMIDRKKQSKLGKQKHKGIKYE